MDMELFSLSNLTAAFKSAYTNALAYVEANSLPASGVELLERMLNDLRAQIIVTQTMQTMGGDRTKLDQIITPTGRSPDNPIGRFVRGEGRLYVSNAAITDWAHKNKISPNDILNECKRRGVFAPHPGHGLTGKIMTADILRRVDLMRGLGTDGAGRQYCYCVDTRKLSEFEPVALGGAEVIPFPTKSADAAVEKPQEAQKP